MAHNFYENKDYDRAYIIYFSYAKQNDLDSINMIWIMLLYGYGVKKNIDSAYLWCKKAAIIGDAKAQFYYASYCFENNFYEDGKIYLDKSLNQNYLDAIHYSASNYAFGDYKYSKDTKKAIVLYKKACLLGKKKACKDLYFVNKNLIGKIKSARYIIKKIGFIKFIKIFFS